MIVVHGCTVQLDVHKFVAVKIQINYLDYIYANARTLKKLRTSRGDYCIKQSFSTITFLLKMSGIRGSESFLLRAVP